MLNQFVARDFFCCGGSIALLQHLVCHGIVKRNEIVLYAILIVAVICYGFCCVLRVTFSLHRMWICCRFTNNCCASPIFVTSDRITKIDHFKLDPTVERCVRWKTSNHMCGR